jgi:hypothetical protein
MAKPRDAEETAIGITSKADQVQYPRKSIHTYIMSWFGKHDNAEKIVKAVTLTSDYVSVIYSDPDIHLSPKFSCPSTRRSNDLFFGDKFYACIASCDTDVTLVIHADCNCDYWSEVPEHCRRAFEEVPNIGVWAPVIDFTDWCLDRTEIDRIPNSSFSMVAQTDAIVFGLERRIVDRIRKAELGTNVYGWGIDLMYNYYTYSIGYVSVVDRSLSVQHPRSTEYDYDTAMTQLVEFLDQLTPAERTQSLLLRAIVRLRDQIKEAETKNSTPVAKQEPTLLNQRILGAATRPKRGTRISEAVRFWFIDLWGNGRDRHPPV